MGILYTQDLRAGGRDIHQIWKDDRPIICTSNAAFTALHGMQSQSSDGNSLRPSVCLSVKRVHCDKTEESYVYIFISYERTFILVF